MGEDDYIELGYFDDYSLQKIFAVLENMPNEDFQKLIYLTVAKICNMFNQDYFDIPDSKRKSYVSMAQISALKTFSSNVNRTYDSLVQIENCALKQLKRIVINQLLFDVVYDEIFNEYMNSENKKEFFENYAINNSNKIINFALSEMNLEMSNKFFKKIEENKKSISEDRNIKNAVVEFWLSYVKDSYPNLSKEDQKKFRDRLMFYINCEYDSYVGSYLNVDYEPCDQLIDAFKQINSDENIYGIFRVFPKKTSTSTCKGKFAKAVDETGINKYIYISPSYFSELKTVIEKQIEIEEAKIPTEIMDKLKEQYQKDVKEDEEKKKVKQKIEDLYKTLETLKQSLENMLGNYSDEIDKIEKLELTDKEKSEKKKEIILKIQQLINRINDGDDINLIKKYKYSYNDLNEEAEKKFEKNKVSCACINSDLYTLYCERRGLNEYEKNNLLINLDVNMSSDPDLTILVDPISHAYADMYIDEIFSVYESNEDLYMRIKSYLQLHSDKILDKNFMRKFLNNELINVFPCEYDNNINNDFVYIEKGIVYRNDFPNQKVYYGEENAVRRYLKKIESKIRFYTDTNNKTMLDSLNFDKGILEDYLQIISKNSKSKIESDEGKYPKLN